MTSTRHRLPTLLTSLMIGSSHFVLIPLLALYGVRICPVLRTLGFNFGCAYSATLVIAILLSSSALFAIFWFGLRRFWAQDATRSGKMQILSWIALVIHAVCFIACSHFLLSFLDDYRVPTPSLERMRLVLAISGALLVVLQATATDSLVVRWCREAAAPGGLGGRGAPSASSQDSFLRTWFFGRIWDALPLLTFILVEGLYLYAKIETWLETEGDQTSLDAFEHELGLITAFLLGWYALVRAFGLFKDRSFAKEIQKHLTAISNLDTSFSSPERPSGSWLPIFQSLNRTTEILGQRARLIRGFSSYVAQTVVEDVLRDKDLTSLGELRPEYILMADLRDFTQMSNRLSPGQTVQLLNTYLNDMLPVLIGHGVSLDKFIGDGILAYLDPKENPGINPADAVVSAAIGMHRALEGTNAKLEAAGLPRLKIGVAIHRGDVVLGNIGATDRMQYTIIGDAVNVTSRLESLCKEFKVGLIISELIWKELSPPLQLQLRELGTREVRGVAEPVKLYGGESTRHGLTSNKVA